MAGNMRIERYGWHGGSEAMLRFGPAEGPVVVVAQPLFEEANRTRAAIVDVLRRLASRGIGSALPDLPGTGESVVATSEPRLVDWLSAFASAAATVGDPRVVAWRGGALVGGEATVRRWFLSPIDGTQVVKELHRMRQAAGSTDYAGNVIADEMIGDLTGAALSGDARVVRLASDRRAADVHLPGAPLWRGSEPKTDPVLQQAIADDIACWVGPCAG